MTTNTHQMRSIPSQHAEGRRASKPDHQLATVYVQRKLMSLSADERAALAAHVGCAISTVDAWTAGHRCPYASVWRSFSSFFGDPSDSVYRAAIESPPSR